MRSIGIYGRFLPKQDARFRYQAVFSFSCEHSPLRRRNVGLETESLGHPRPWAEERVGVSVNQRPVLFQPHTFHKPGRANPHRTPRRGWR